MASIKLVKVDSPLAIAAPTVKQPNRKFILNLNRYRNTHYTVLNKMKRLYGYQMEDKIKPLPHMPRILVAKFTVFPKDKRKFDVANVCSIHDKFFMDNLVEHGKLPDDNYEYVPAVMYCFGDISRDNPRVEIEIKYEELTDEDRENSED